MNRPPRRPPECPVCKQPTQPETAPLCSLRCRQVDLYRWLSGSYVVPGRREDADES